MAYHITSGAGYRLQMHLVLVTKYRKKVINKQRLSRLEQLKAYVQNQEAPEE